MRRRNLDAVPLPVRDELFRSFALSLDRGDCAAAFERLAGEILRRNPESADYVRDRLARFRRVLRGWRRRGARTPADLHDEIELARLLFSAGLYFDTHELLETPWKRSQGALKRRLQGCIQLAAALHKLELDPKARAGARYLALRGFEKLEGL